MLYCKKISASASGDAEGACVYDCERVRTLKQSRKEIGKGEEGRGKERL